MALARACAKGTASVQNRPIDGATPHGDRPARPISLEDFELIEKVKSGQTEAFGDLVRKYQDRVFNVCWRICGNLEDARDLTQDSFLKVFERIGGFRGESAFYTWLYRIAVNLALTLRRKGAGRRMLSLDQPDSSLGTQAERLMARTQEGQDVARNVAEADQQARLVRQLQAMDDEPRAVIVLRDIEGLNYEEIAAIMEVPVGTIKSRLFRARMTLRDAMLPAEPHADRERRKNE